MAEGFCVHSAQRPTTVRHQNRWFQRQTEVTCQQVVVGEADQLYRQQYYCRDQWAARITVLRADQMQAVADDVSLNANVLAEVVQAEQVDGLTVELLDVVAWHA